jgi:hypothetical protein
MTASFLPPLPPLDIQRSKPQPPALSLAPPRTPHLPESSTVGGAPPVTPNPYPATSEGEERYAGVEGVTVWEGEVGLIDEEGKRGKGRQVVRKDGGWTILWQGELPIG